MFSALSVVLMLSALLTPQVAHASTTIDIDTGTAATSSVAAVPFYSQFKDISSAKWQKVGCGIASLAMVVDYFSTSTISVDKLLSQGITAGAYSEDGWTYSGLIALAKKYGLSGESRILYNLSSDAAFKKLKKDLQSGPVLASVHYKFDPKNPIPHLVVLTKIEGGMVYVNDPAAITGDKKIPVDDFIKSWKKRYIVLQVQTKIS